MKEMQLLLVDDELEYRLDFKEYISDLVPRLGYPLSLYLAEGELQALDLIQKITFDAIVLDLELHQGDGDGINLLKKINSLNLSNKPYIVVATFISSPLTKETARTHGADYIFWKRKTDFSPALVMEHICVYFQSIYNIQPRKAYVDKNPSLKQVIEQRLNKNGFTDDLLGKKYIIDAITIVIKSNDPDINLHSDVFPIISRRYKKSIASINRAIESAINKAWSITDAETLTECYPLVVSGTKGTPTNKELIFHYAHYIKGEGKA